MINATIDKYYVGKEKLREAEKGIGGGNPFKVREKYGVPVEVILLEDVGSVKFYDLIKDKSVSENALYSVVKQVLLALSIAQRDKGFTHYDLHPQNIMIRRCPKDTVFLYRLSEGDSFAIPTYGYYPVIIDCGFSYSKDLEDDFLDISLAHTDIGFTSDRFNKLADPRLFLITSSRQIKRDREKSERSRVLRRIVRNLFSFLPIDMETGWYKDERESVAGKLVDELEMIDVTVRGGGSQESSSSSLSSSSLSSLSSRYHPSKIFRDYLYLCVDILQSLVVLPLSQKGDEEKERKERNERNERDKVTFLYTSLVREWGKIEDNLTNPVFSLYLFREVVDSFKVLRPLYLTVKSESGKGEVIKSFRESIYSAVESISSFLVIKGVNFEVLFLSLLGLGTELEEYLATEMRKVVKKRAEWEKGVPLDSVEKIFACIDVNIPCDYKYKEDTVVFAFDTLGKGNRVVEMRKLMGRNGRVGKGRGRGEVLERINECHVMLRGNLLAEMIDSTQS